MIDNLALFSKEESDGQILRGVNDATKLWEFRAAATEFAEMFSLNKLMPNCFNPKIESGSKLLSVFYPSRMLIGHR